jgi:enoyl-CoA hydratase
MAAAMDEVEADDGVRVAVLCGAPPSFSAGYDLYEESRGPGFSPPEWVGRFKWSWDIFLKIWHSRKPYVTAVQGHALAGALDLCLLSDVTLAATDAKFGVPEIRHASGPGAGMLPWVVGMKAAKLLMLTGDSIDAATARDIGMVNEVVDVADLHDRAIEIASTLMNIPSQVLWLNKLAINRTYERMGMLAAIEENYTISAVVNATDAYVNLEDERRESADLRGFFARRDQPFA